VLPPPESVNTDFLIPPCLARLVATSRLSPSVRARQITILVLFPLLLLLFVLVLIFHPSRGHFPLVELTKARRFSSFLSFHAEDGVLPHLNPMGSEFFCSGALYPLDPFTAPKGSPIPGSSGFEPPRRP